MDRSTATETEVTKENPTLGNASYASPDPGRGPSPRSPINASIIIVMGVSGTGKSTLGTALAGKLRVPFIDGDDLHPVENVAKMARGEPLDDVDRRPWLERIRRSAVGCVRGQLDHGATVVTGSGGSVDEVRRPGVIVACSALKKAYRAVLRGEGVQTQSVESVSVHTYFVFLEGEREVLMARMQQRQGHFMKAGMLESQLDTLESPEGEPGVVTVTVGMSTEEQVRRVVEALG